MRLPLFCAAALAASLLGQQTDWPAYGHDAGNQRYSSLNQINTGNVSRLAQAWAFDMVQAGDQLVAFSLPR